MRCGDCKHYEPARNPETNRPLPSQDGSCTYPVEWQKLPKSFLPDPWAHYGNIRRFQFPVRRTVWINNDEQCEVFSRREDKPKRVEENQELVLEVNK